MTPLLQSAILEPTAPLKWSNAEEPDNSGLLSAVNPNAPLDITEYRARDRQLLYRDLQLVSSYLQVLYTSANIWGANPADIAPVVSLPFYVSGTVERPVDLMSIPVNGSFTYVQPTSRVVDAATVDDQLRVRDQVLSEAIKVVELAISGSAVPSYASMHAWTLGQGQGTPSELDGAGILSTSLFSDVDSYLAYRDNVIASAVAALGNSVSNLFQFANRILVEVSGTSPFPKDIYILISDTSTERVWASVPLLDGRLRLTYNKILKTVRWTDENFRSTPDIQIDTAIRSSLSFAGAVAGQTVSIIPEIPSNEVAGLWMTKAGLLQAEETQSSLAVDWSASITSAKNSTSCAVNGSFAAGDTVFVRATTTALVGADNTPAGLTLTLDSGAFTAAPTCLLNSVPGYSDVLAFPIPNNTAGAHLTLTNSGSLNNMRKLVFDHLSVKSTSANAATPAVAQYSDWKAEMLRRTIRDLQASYGATVSDSMLQPVYRVKRLRKRQVCSPLSIRAGSPYALDYVSHAGTNSVRVTIPPTLGIRYKGEWQVGTPAYPIRYRADSKDGDGNIVAYGDFVTSTATGTRRYFRCISAPSALNPVTQTQTGYDNAQVTNSDCWVEAPFLFNEGSTVIFYPGTSTTVPYAQTITAVDMSTDVSAYDLGTLNISVAQGLGESVGKCVDKIFAPKVTAQGLPLGLTMDPYTLIISGTVEDEARTYEVNLAADNGSTSSLLITVVDSTRAAGDDFVWDAGSTGAWMSTLANMDETVFTAFRLGLSSDIGMPALIPLGIGFNPVDGITMSRGARTSIPAIGAFMPWMLDAGIYVADENYWTDQSVRLC